MTQPERLLLLAFFALILAGLVRLAPLVGSTGLVVGLVAGVAAAGRLGRLRSRIDARLGTDDRRTGFSLRTVLLRVVAHLLVLGALVLPTVLVPFIGDELFAGAAAFATAVPLVLTAARLRRAGPPVGSAAPG